MTSRPFPDIFANDIGVWHMSQSGRPWQILENMQAECAFRATVHRQVHDMRPNLDVPMLLRRGSEQM